MPGSWNEQYEDLFNYLDLAWYVTRTYVPQSWQGQRVFLRVGSANYHGTVYVNGTKVGEHEGGHLPFAFEITDLVKLGRGERHRHQRGERTEADARAARAT